MAISLKNVDDRLRVLENNKLTKLADIVTDNNKVKVKYGQPASLKSAHFRTANWMMLDSNILDNCDTRMLKSSNINLSIMRSPKTYYICDSYAEGMSQGLELTLKDDTLYVSVHNYGVNSTTVVWIRWLAVFKYYLNTVLGWVM